LINVGSSLNNLETEAKNVEVAINLEDLELKMLSLRSIIENKLC
jgi:hypothetical protein